MSKNIKQSLKPLFSKNSWITHAPARWQIIFNPYFTIRRGLLLKIQEFSRADFSQKKILDVGCGEKPYQKLFNALSYTGIDVKGGGHNDKYKQVDLFFDGINIPFPDNSFDVVICTEVFEHVTDPEKLLKEISRVLNTGGQIYFTIPFTWNEHSIPYDFRRYTRYGLQKIFKESGLTVTKLEGTGGIFGVCGQLLAASMFEMSYKKPKAIRALIILLFCFPVQLISILLDKIFKIGWMTLNYCVVAKK